MKKSTVSIITNLIGISILLFGMASAWFDKMDYIMIIPFALVCVALVSFKNDGLKKFIYAVLKIKSDA